jgi:hypothetical protein
LNLNDRLKERIKEKRKSEQLKEKKDSFKQISYPSKKIQLSIVDEQILQSRKARGLDQNRTESSEEFEIPESFDLRLHESLNILTDYLEYSNASASTSRSIQNPQEI